jgi:hypothetical protein
MDSWAAEDRQEFVQKLQNVDKAFYERYERKVSGEEDRVNAEREAEFAAILASAYVDPASDPPLVNGVKEAVKETPGATVSTLVNGVKDVVQGTENVTDDSNGSKVDGPLEVFDAPSTEVVVNGQLATLVYLDEDRSPESELSDAHAQPDDVTSELPAENGGVPNGEEIFTVIDEVGPEEGEVE